MAAPFRRRAIVPPQSAPQRSLESFGPLETNPAGATQEERMKKVLMVVGLVVLALVLFIVTRPGRFRVERSATIAAPAEVVFSQLEDFHRWPAWSPWEKLDPHLKRTLSGADRGVGAIYHWAGNDSVGEGQMTITESDPPSRLGIKLEFLKPFAATSTTTFLLAPAGPDTRVTWTMEGNNNFLAKAMSLFMNMDKMVGADFERGLANLGAVAQAEAQAGEATPAAGDTAAAGH
jgi:hypothetical protein